MRRIAIRAFRAVGWYFSTPRVSVVSEGRHCRQEHSPRSPRSGGRALLVVHLGSVVSPFPPTIVHAQADFVPSDHLRVKAAHRVTHPFEGNHVGEVMQSEADLLVVIAQVHEADEFMFVAFDGPAGVGLLLVEFVGWPEVLVACAHRLELDYGVFGVAAPVAAAVDRHEDRFDGEQVRRSALEEIDDLDGPDRRLNPAG